MGDEEVRVGTGAERGGEARRAEGTVGGEAARVCAGAGEAERLWAVAGGCARKAVGGEADLFAGPARYERGNGGREGSDG